MEYDLSSVIKFLKSISLPLIRGEIFSTSSKESKISEIDLFEVLINSLSFLTLDSPIPLLGTLTTRSNETKSLSLMRNFKYEIISFISLRS